MSVNKTPIRYEEEKWGAPDPGRRIDLDSDKAAEILAAFQADEARKAHPPSSLSPQAKRGRGRFNPYRGKSLRRKLSEAERVEILWRIELEDRYELAEAYGVSPTTISRTLGQEV